MTQTKKNLIKSLTLIMFIAMSMLFYSTVIAKASVITPNKINLSVQASYNDNAVTFSTSGAGESNLTYEYWVKQQVKTDNALDTYGFIWQKLDHNGSATTAPIAVSELLSVLDNTKLCEVNVIARDSNGEYVASIFKSITLEEAGFPTFTEIAFDGVVVSNGTVILEKKQINTVTVSSNVAGATYALKVDGSAAIENQTGEFSIDIRGYAAGNHKFNFSINGTELEKNVTVYVYDEFIPSQTPVIKSFTPNKVNATTSDFTLKVANADNSALADASSATCVVLSNGVALAPFGEPTINGDGTVSYVFRATNLNNGVFIVTASVSKTGVLGTTDSAYLLYKAHARESSVDFVASNAGNVWTLTANNAQITGANSANLEYAFYREDAQGWSLIKNYSAANSYIFNATRPGVYNFQVRVTDKTASSFEIIINKEITVGANSLSGTLGLVIYDATTKLSVDSVVAGRPYILKANYQGAETDVLYRFSAYAPMQELAYLNTFSPASELIYIPNKTTNVTLKAHAISQASFGYTDAQASSTIESNAVILHPSQNSSISFETGLAASGVSYTSSYGGGAIVSNNYFKTDGEYSLGVVVNVNDGSPKLTIAQPFVEKLLYFDYIMFDIYLDGVKAHGGYFNSGAGYLPTISPKTATTVKMPTSVIANSNLVITLYNDGDRNEEFNFYVDNIRGGFDDVTAYIGEQVNLTANITALETKLGATFKNLVVVNSNGQQTFESTSYLTSKSGVNQVFMVFEKSGYADIEFKINVNVLNQTLIEGFAGGLNVGIELVTQPDTTMSWSASHGYSTKFNIGINSGYPGFFATSLTYGLEDPADIVDYAEITFTLYSTGVNNHPGYFMFGDNSKYLYFTLVAGGYTQVTLSRADIVLLKNTWGFQATINNDGANGNEAFSLYITSITGVKLTSLTTTIMLEDFESGVLDTNKFIYHNASESPQTAFSLRTDKMGSYSLYVGSSWQWGAVNIHLPGLSQLEVGDYIVFDFLSFTLGTVRIIDLDWTIELFATKYSASNVMTRIIITDPAAIAKIKADGGFSIHHYNDKEPNYTMHIDNIAIVRA